MIFATHTNSTKAFPPFLLFQSFFPLLVSNGNVCLSSLSKSLISCIKPSGTSNDVVDFLKPRAGSSGPSIPGVKLDLSKVLDGERYLEVINPIPIDGGNFKFRNKTVGVYDVGKAAVVKSESVMLDDAGKEYVKIVSSGGLCQHIGMKYFYCYFNTC